MSMGYPSKSELHRRQGGLSLISLLVVIGVVAGLVTAGLKLAPHYMQYAMVKAAMDKQVKDPPSPLGPQSLVNAVGNQLYIDDVKDVTQREFKIKPVTNGYELSVEYEVRKPLFYNIDAMLKFDHKVVIPRQ
ncbi:MAG: DUF4845 domain-containing protein [Chromatiaceae bacterium]|jgi:hypothetical protein|nr:DUF4845 domain-containing protein [Chromatiaceae bacterium]